MIVEGIKRSMIGIAFGGIFTFIMITIILFTDTEMETTISKIWLYMLCSYIIGIYFGISSFIFEDNGWSNLKQTTIHFFLSIIVYFSIALPVGWIPITVSAILLSILLFIITYTLFWTGYYLYYKRMERKMNANLSK